MTVADRKRQVLSALQTGASVQVALDYAGVSAAEWGRWLRSAKFAQEVRRAEAVQDMLIAGTLRKAQRADPAYAERAVRRSEGVAMLDRLRDISGACR